MFLARLVGLIISCSKLYSSIFLLLYHVYISFYFNFQSHMNFFIQVHAYVIKFFFSLIKTHIFHLIQVFLIVITFQKLWCLMIHGTYFVGFSHLDFIHHIVNNGVVFLFFLEPFPRYVIAPAVLSRMGFIILSSKFSQDLALIRRISSAVDHTYFLFAPRVIYI